MRVLYRSLFGLVILFAAIASIAQRRDNPDSIVLNRAHLVSQTDRIEVYRDEINVDEGLAAEIDRLYLAIEAQLGRKFDVATLGKKIKGLLGSDPNSMTPIPQSSSTNRSALPCK
jgi:hypothetical protein